MFSTKFNLVKVHDLYQNLRFFSVSKPNHVKFRNIEKAIPKNALKDHQNNMYLENGFTYDTKPFKLLLKKDKLYAWCLCGYSKSQPLCDCTHRMDELRIKSGPIFFKVEETKHYWLCNCKQTTHRPFCDGTHLSLVQSKESATDKQDNTQTSK